MYKSWNAMKHNQSTNQPIIIHHGINIFIKTAKAGGIKGYCYLSSKYNGFIKQVQWIYQEGHC